VMGPGPGLMGPGLATGPFPALMYLVHDELLFVDRSLTSF